VARSLRRFAHRGDPIHCGDQIGCRRYGDEITGEKKVTSQSPASTVATGLSQSTGGQAPPLRIQPATSYERHFFNQRQASSPWEKTS